MSEQGGEAIQEGVAIVRAQPLPREQRAPAHAPAVPPLAQELAPVLQQESPAAVRDEDATESGPLDREVSGSSEGGEVSETLRQSAASLQGAAAAAMERAGSPVGSGGPGGQGYETVERLKWTPSLHEQFVAAVNACGGPMQAKPKEILDTMQISGLSLNHVKSHLQKYRRTMQPQDLLHRPPPPLGPLPDSKRPRTTSTSLAGPSMAAPMQQAQHPMDLPLLAASGGNPMYQAHQQAASDPTHMIGLESQHHPHHLGRHRQQHQQLALPALQPTLLRSPQSAFQPALNFPGSAQAAATPSALLSGTFYQGQSLAGAPAPAVSSCVASEAAPQQQGLYRQAQHLQLHHQQAAQALTAGTMQAFADALGLGASRPTSSSLAYQAVQQQRSAEALFQRAGELAAQQAPSPRHGASETMRILQDAALAQQAQRWHGLEADALGGPLPGLPRRLPAAGRQGRDRPLAAQHIDHGRPRLEEASTTALGQAPGREARPSAEPAAGLQDENGESANLEQSQSEEGGLLGAGQAGGVGPGLLGQAAQVMGSLDLVFRQQLQALGRLQEELRSTIAMFTQAQGQVQQHITTLAGIGQALQALEVVVPAGLAGPVPHAQAQAGAGDYHARLLSVGLALPGPAVAAALPAPQQLADHGQGSSPGQGQGAGVAAEARACGPPATGPPDFSPAQLDLLRQLFAQNPRSGGLPY